MERAIINAEVPHCLTPQCNGLVKPDIVFFGEALPEDFHKHRLLPSTADLCIVMGTSLSVQPFASLPSFCSEGVPRILINLERVGGLGTRSDDVLILGDCDAGVQKLAMALGWDEELRLLWDETDCERQNTFQDQDESPKTKDEKLHDEIISLTREVDKSLKISSDYDAEVRMQLAKGEDKEAKSAAAANPPTPDRVSQTPVDKQASVTASLASHPGTSLTENTKPAVQNLE